MLGDPVAVCGYLVVGGRLKAFGQIAVGRQSAVCVVAFVSLS